VFLALARGATRKHAIRALLLGGAALYLLLGDPQIVERFTTTFVSAEERDGAARGRIEYWRAGLAMIPDYPLGAGGGAFKYVLGRFYSERVSGRIEDRSLHNGYLTEATDWGVQGLFLKLLFIGAALLAAYRTSERARRAGRDKDALMGLCMIASIAGYLIASMFGSYLASEWVYWVVALLVRYSELYAPQEGAASLALGPSALPEGAPRAALSRV
jgi:O-antigen ligase